MQDWDHLAVDWKPEMQRNRIRIVSKWNDKQFKELKAESRTEEETEKSVSVLQETLN